MGYFKDLYSRGARRADSKAEGFIRQVIDGVETKVEFRKGELENLIGSLKLVAGDLTPSKRQRFLDYAAIPVRTLARAKAPRSKKLHYYYRNVKKGRRRGNGSAFEDAVPIFPGNVAKSIAILKFKRDRSSVYVGPKYNPTAGRLNAVGRTIKTADPFYAPMIYGSAEAFKDNVITPALNSLIPEVIKRLESKISDHIRGIKRKTGL
jgi:hypothetical protein